MKKISYSDGRTVPSVIVIWEDLHTERAGYFRAFWADSPEGTSGSPVLGYCDSGPDGQWGTYRTIKAAAYAARRLHPGELVYRNGRIVK